MAISEKSLKDVELMAIEEINKAGGVLGKKIEPVVEDPESKFTDVFPEKAKKLLLKDKVVAVFGCWTSVSRKNVLPVFEENNGLLFYPVQYEGNECSKNVVYTGCGAQPADPAGRRLAAEQEGRQQEEVLPARLRLRLPAHGEPDHRQVPRRPRASKPVGERSTRRWATRSTPPIVQDIKKAEPDVIFSTINGDSNINFYNELAAAGHHGRQVSRSSPSASARTSCAASTPSKVKGHLAAWNYFQSVDTPEEQGVRQEVQGASTAKDRVTDDPIEAAYIGVYFWKMAVEKAGSTDVDKVREAFKSDIEFDAPERQGQARSQDAAHLQAVHAWARSATTSSSTSSTRPTRSSPIRIPQVAFPGWSATGPRAATKGEPVEDRSVKQIVFTFGPGALRAGARAELRSLRLACFDDISAPASKNVRT